MRVPCILVALALSCLCLADERSTFRAFERAKASEPELIRFLRQMPKGGDLHNHVSGAVYSDFMLDSQVNRVGRYFNPSTNQFTNDNTGVPAGQLLQNNSLLYSWLNVVSMRGWNGLGQSGHDLFFNSFSYFGSAMDGMTSAQVLKEVVSRALWQGEHYMELMTSVAPGDAVNQALANPPKSDDMRVALGVLRPRLEKLLAASGPFLTGRDQELTRLLGLRESVSSPKSPITLRYIWSCNRLSSNDDFFAQAAAGLYLAAKEPRIVALNIVAPEDHPNARNNFDRQMEMLDFLWNELGRPNVTLHAAELTLPISPVEAMRDRIWKTIQQGHAKRIGHGVAVAWSDRVDDLLSLMRREGVAVEICLSSNNSILGVSGDRHPLRMYRQAGVPTFLNTDDEGVSRSNLTMEHVRAVTDQKLGYLDLKEMARNSIEYSFLRGGSLYEGRNYSKLRPEFKEVRTAKWAPSKTAQDLMSVNEKLAVQVRLERSFVSFESSY